MPNSWDDSLVMCPFYLKNDGRSITCEGFPGACTHKQIYPDGKAYRHHMRKYCQTWGFQECEVYRLIMESKYDDDTEYERPRRFRANEK